jgi:hypothetical protein
MSVIPDRAKPRVQMSNPVVLAGPRSSASTLAETPAWWSRACGRAAVGRRRDGRGALRRGGRPGLRGQEQRAGGASTSSSLIRLESHSYQTPAPAAAVLAPLPPFAKEPAGRAAGVTDLHISRTGARAGRPGPIGPGALSGRAREKDQGTLEALGQEHDRTRARRKLRRFSGRGQGGLVNGFSRLRMSHECAIIDLNKSCLEQTDDPHPHLHLSLAR